MQRTVSAMLSKKLVLQPSELTTVITEECFGDLSVAAYPVKLDFSHDNFRLASLEGLNLVKPSTVKEIDLSNNKLEALELSVEYTALRILKAPHNQICTLLVESRRLSQLIVPRNKLRKFPQIEHIPLLEVLDVAYNDIDDSFRELLKGERKFKKVNVSGNQLKAQTKADLHAELMFLKQLPSLTELGLAANPFTLRHRDYRSITVGVCPKLLMVDDDEVTRVEVSAALDVLIRSSLGQPQEKVVRVAPAASGAKKGRVFGMTIAAVAQAEEATMPGIVDECVGLLERNNEPEMFFAAPSEMELEQLKHEFERDVDAGSALSATMRPNVTAHVLRHFFEALIEPPIPYWCQQQLLDACARESKRHAAMAKALSVVPPPNALSVVRVGAMLERFVQQPQVNTRKVLKLWGTLFLGKDTQLSTANQGKITSELLWYSKLEQDLSDGDQSTAGSESDEPRGLLARSDSRFSQISGSRSRHSGLGSEGSYSYSYSYEPGSSARLEEESGAGKKPSKVKKLDDSSGEEEGSHSQGGSYSYSYSSYSYSQSAKQAPGKRAAGEESGSEYYSHQSSFSGVPKKPSAKSPRTASGSYSARSGSYSYSDSDSESDVALKKPPQKSVSKQSLGKRSSKQSLSKKSSKLSLGKRSSQKDLRRSESKRSGMERSASRRSMPKRSASKRSLTDKSESRNSMRRSKSTSKPALQRKSSMRSSHSRKSSSRGKGHKTSKKRELVSDEDPDNMNALGLVVKTRKSGPGVKVAKIHGGSPAAECNMIDVHDRLVKVNDKDVSKMDADKVHELLASFAVGKKVTLKIERELVKGQQGTESVTITAAMYVEDKGETVRRRDAPDFSSGFESESESPLSSHSDSAEESDADGSGADTDKPAAGEPAEEHPPPSASSARSAASESAPARFPFSWDKGDRDDVSAMSDLEIDELYQIRIGLDDAPSLSSSPHTAPPTAGSVGIPGLERVAPNAAKWMERIDGWVDSLHKGSDNLRMKTALLEVWKLKVDFLSERMHRRISTPRPGSHVNRQWQTVPFSWDDESDVDSSEPDEQAVLASLVAEKMAHLQCAQVALERTELENARMQQVLSEHGFEPDKEVDGELRSRELQRKIDRIKEQIGAEKASARRLEDEHRVLTEQLRDGEEARKQLEVQAAGAPVALGKVERPGASDAEQVVRYKVAMEAARQSATELGGTLKETEIMHDKLEAQNSLLQQQNAQLAAQLKLLRSKHGLLKAENEAMQHTLSSHSASYEREQSLGDSTARELRKRNEAIAALTNKALRLERALVLYS